MYTARGTDIDVVELALGGPLGPVDVELIPAVAAVDDRVVGLEERGERVDGVADECGGDHHPDAARGIERSDQLFE